MGGAAHMMMRCPLCAREYIYTHIHKSCHMNMNAVPDLNDKMIIAL